MKMPSLRVLSLKIANLRQSSVNSATVAEVCMKTGKNSPFPYISLIFLKDTTLKCGLFVNFKVHVQL